MDKCAETLAWLESMAIEYELVRHEAAYTMQDMEAQGITEKGLIAKNLFLRDAKGRRHMLVCVAGDKRVDLRTLGEQLGERLSFASEERLQKHLGLQKGEVTPLGVYYNVDHTVAVFLDEDLAEAERIGVHPCDNSATVFITYVDLKKILQNVGNVFLEIKL